MTQWMCSNSHGNTYGKIWSATALITNIALKMTLNSEYIEAGLESMLRHPQWEIKPLTVSKNVRVKRIQFKSQTIVKMAKIALLLGSGKINSVRPVIINMPPNETECHFTVLWGE
jgi:hypothetical protein